ncbi:urease accessory protein UreF [Bermanella sp. WJH001]|uniref:urease accessory protein UreF n=1 Tax=Bermanella sp. WJH001 TaxID=3048005 RepID=UPI0024BECB1F|nr:urease accessory UreF family protein [Bermanella sp. WJH001]MDJ1538957.1 urease accessory UreF family protein [Bermanella sp. WJH001]
MSQSDSHSLLALLHLSSPALPVGAFAYSQGLEYALDCGWCKNDKDVKSWIEDNLRLGFGQLDLPIYIRMFNAWQNKQVKDVKHWNQTLLSFRESKELFLEDVQVGSAYVQWHLGQDANRDQWVNAVEQPTVVAMNALAACLNNIDLSTALMGFAWSWCENQVTCASKALPLGQTQAQQILQALIPVISDVCEQAKVIADDEIGSGLMGLAISSSLHEQQYSRLFRS